MKYLLSLMLCPIFVFAKNHIDSTGILPYVDGKIHYVNEVKADSLSKESLIENAIIWFNKTTHDYNNSISDKQSFGLIDNIIIQNIDKGEFVGTLNMLVPQSLSVTLISFDVYIHTKDGAYKCDFTDFKYLGNSLVNNMAGKNMNYVYNLENSDRKRFVKLMTAINKKCEQSIHDLNQQMSKTNF